MTESEQNKKNTDLFFEKTSTFEFQKKDSLKALWISRSIYV